MEVKEASASYLRTTRYKQTELGVIPEDWVVYTIQELIDRNAITGHLDGNHGELYPRSHEFRESGVPYITANDFSGHKVSFDNCKYLSVERARRFRKGIAKDGDVLFAHNATVGPTALLSTEFEYVILSTTATYFRCNLEKLNNSFLLYELQSSFFVRQYRAVMAQSTRNQVPITAQRKLSVVLPPTKAEQEAIAEALSDADALIESLSLLLAKKRHLKQGAMQQLLTGKKRLPGFVGEWVQRPLMDLVKAEKFAIVDGPFGTQMKVEEYVSEGVPVIEMEHLNDCVITQRLERCITPKKFEQLKRSAVYPDDIVISKTGSLGYLGVIPHSVERGIITSRLAKISLNPTRANGAFIFQYLLKLRYDGYWETVSQGGTMQILGIRMLQNAPIPNISIPEQTAIAAILSDMDTEITALEEKLAKASAIKQGMMQELLTGRIRLVRPGSNVVQLPVKKEAGLASKSHNWQINEAVVISVLAKHFGSEQWPLGRKRYTKLSYLLHRRVERQAEGYLKKAAGPYNPETKYKGPEGIALKNRYVRFHSRDKFSGFVAAEKIGEAEGYFSRWYGKDVLAWLEQFRRKSNDELELLATVDMAMNDLRRGGKAAELATVKKVIQGHPEWEAKLDRAIFSDDNIRRAIESCRQLFAFEEADG